MMASSIFGTVGIAVQTAVAAGLALPMLLAVRYLATAGAVHSIALARREHRVRPFGRPHLAAFTLGLASIAQTGCYFAALTRLDVALVLALHFTFPAIVLLVEASLARRAPTPRQLGSCLLALLGVAFVVLASGSTGADPLGLLLACGSGVIYAGVVMATSRIMRSLPPTAVTAFQSTGLGVGWLVACLVMGVRFHVPGLSGVQWIAFITVFCSVLPMLLLASGTAKVGPVASSTLATMEPVVGALVAAVLLHQTPSPLAILGSVLIVGGSLVVVAPAPERGLRWVRVGVHRATRELVQWGTERMRPEPLRRLDRPALRRAPSASAGSTRPGGAPGGRRGSRRRLSR